MLEESDRAWDKIGSRSYAFHALRDECAHLRLISLQQVRLGGGRWRDGGSAFLRYRSAGCASAAAAAAGAARRAPAGMPARLPRPAVPPPLPCQVRDFYGTYFAPGAPARRKFSVHIVGRGHAAELAAEAPEGVQQVPDPQALRRELPLWPAMLGDARACG